MWMLRGKREHDWAIAASQMAILANVHAGKGKTFTAADFNPMVDESEIEREEPIKVDGKGLKKAFQSRGMFNLTDHFIDQHGGRDDDSVQHPPIENPRKNHATHGHGGSERDAR